MTNELLFILFTLFCLGSALLCYRFGRAGLEIYIIVSTVTLYCAGGKLISLFGFTVNFSTATYAGIFLATDILTEKYGKEAGYKMIRRAFAAALLFMAILQFSLLFTPVPYIEALSGGMDTVFGTSLRLFFASITAYLVAQHLDVWLYHFFQTKTGGKYLWLRNNFSTSISQCVDSIMFLTIAFYGVVPNLIEIIWVGYIAKLLIALCDTPFMYLSRKITPLDLKIYEAK